MDFSLEVDNLVLYMRVPYTNSVTRRKKQDLKRRHFFYCSHIKNFLFEGLTDQPPHTPHCDYFILVRTFVLVGQASMRFVDVEIELGADGESNRKQVFPVGNRRRRPDGILYDSISNAKNLIPVNNRIIVFSVVEPPTDRVPLSRNVDCISLLYRPYCSPSVAHR